MRFVSPFRLIIAVSVAAALSGCGSVGPKSVAVDRFDYSTSIGDSWKQQTLINIVKLRYMDLPVFVEVASVVAGYSLQTGVSVNGTTSSERAVQGDFLAGSAQAVYTDRPTITYVPLTGEKFMRSLIAPIDPKSIFSMVQAGYAADFILALTVESLNGVRNRSVTGGFREADAEFTRALDLLREVQAAGGVGLRVEQAPTKDVTAVLFFRRDDVTPEIAAKADEVRRLLKMPLGQEKFTIVFSPIRRGDGELAVNSRSMLQIMAAFASYIDVPPEHVRDHSATPGVTEATGAARKVCVHSGTTRPSNAFAAVQYRGYWFWIEQGDWQTKRALTSIMFFFALAESGGDERVPLITIPAQ